MRKGSLQADALRHAAAAKQVTGEVMQDAKSKVNKVGAKPALNSVIHVS